MIEVCFCEKAHFYFTPPLPSQSKFLFFWWVEGTVEKYWGTETKNIKKQPFGDACASHLSLVLWHV